MADLVLGVAKFLVEGTLSKAQSVIEEEKKLRESAQRDLVFITGEFQMMQSFLNATSKEHVKNNIVSTWVTQVRDLAYDVEDGIEFVIHLDTKSMYWRRFFIPPCLAGPLPLDEAVANIQQLRARVEDVSQRSERYNAITDSGTRPIMEMNQPGASSEAVFDMLKEAKHSAARKQRDMDVLTEFITRKDRCLQVISVWARGRELETASIIRKVYDDSVCRSFPCRAWVKVMHPFNPREFIQSLLSQFYFLSEQQGEIRGIDVLNRIKTATAAEHHLVQEFTRQLNSQKYLIVLDDLSNMVEWDAIRTYLPDRKNGSRIIVSTQHFEIACFCTGHSYLERLSDDQSSCVLINMVNNGANISDDEISRRKIEDTRKLMIHYPLVGRESQIDELRNNYLMKAAVSTSKVISVWGTNGVGKTDIVRSVYYKMLDEHKPLFPKSGWIVVSHPFNVRAFSRTLLQDFCPDSIQAHVDPIEECRKILASHTCLIVIDDLRSTEEWDTIQAALVSGTSTKSTIIIITSEASIASHCADTEALVFNVQCLEDDAALDLLIKEVKRMKPSSKISDDPELRDLILRCGGLPKVIIAVAGLLAQKPVKWIDSVRAMNSQFIHYLETKPEFNSLHGLFGWMHSYFHALPDPLRQRIAYLSIFPGHCIIRRRRLVMRWVAEGYSKDSDNYTADEIGEQLFSKLVELSMIQPPGRRTIKNMRMVQYQVSAFYHEYIISRPVEHNIRIALEIFALKGHCLPTTQRRGRHLVIEESWCRDIIVFENIDFSRLRSLTVFGNWESFFISKSMKVLRVLDLEDANGVTDKDVKKILKQLPRLKFLSLRGCIQVSNLPNSVGDLRQLLILDIRGTSIATMPSSIAKLKKLQYIRAGTTSPEEYRSRPPTGVSWLSKLIGRRQLVGVKVPTGISNLTALHTLGVVNVSAKGGKSILKELRNLKHLRKLGMFGVNTKNSKEFCSAISSHTNLESLSLWVGDGNQDFLNGISSTPKKLRSLKLYGLVKELPAWISDLPKLTKLDLEIAISADAGILKVLANIQELCVLRLCIKPLQYSSDVNLDFGIRFNGVEMPCFKRINVLQIGCSSRLHVTFGSQAMKNVELLMIWCCSDSDLQFAKLECLSKLKEVRLLFSRDDTLEDLAILKRDLETLQTNLKAETLNKNLDSQLQKEVDLFLLSYGNTNDSKIDLDKFKKDLGALKKELVSLKEGVGTLRKDLRALRKEGLETINNDLETLKKDLNKVEKDLKTDTLKNQLNTQHKDQILKSQNETHEDLETIKKDLETLKKDFVIMKTLNNDVEALKRALETHKKGVETVKKEVETLVTNDVETLNKDEEILSTVISLRMDLEKLIKDMKTPEDVDIAALKMKLETLKQKLKLEKLEKVKQKLETLKNKLKLEPMEELKMRLEEFRKKNLEKLTNDLTEQLFRHPKNPDLNLKYPA